MTSRALPGARPLGRAELHNGSRHQSFQQSVDPMCGLYDLICLKDLTVDFNVS